MLLRIMLKNCINEGARIIAVFPIVFIAIEPLLTDACATTTTQIPCPECVNNPANNPDPPLDTPINGVTTTLTSLVDENGCVVNVFNCDCGANNQCVVSFFENPGQQGNQQDVTAPSPVQFVARCTTDGSATWTISAPNGQTYEAASFRCRTA